MTAEKPKSHAQVKKERAAARRRRAEAPIPQAFREFDSLPASAFVRLWTVALVFGISAPTVWRWCKSGALPVPIRIGQRCTVWEVGALREAKQKLAANGGGVAR